MWDHASQSRLKGYLPKESVIPTGAQRSGGICCLFGSAIMQHAAILSPSSDSAHQAIAYPAVRVDVPI
jgi:hypothetical protein